MTQLKKLKETLRVWCLFRMLMGEGLKPVESAVRYSASLAEG